MWVRLPPGLPNTLREGGMEKYCKGCIEKDACPIQDCHVEEICPCSKCLVKVCCKTGCSGYDVFYRKYSEIDQHLLKRKERNSNENF